MGEAEKLAAMTTDARIVEAIKSTDYKYFGDYEMSDGQRDAVDVLVVAARELMKLRTDHDAALRRAKAEGIRMVETYARACVHERAVQLDGFTGSSGMAGVIRGKQSEADRIVDWAYACAAQIEEGE